jgi:hypothetical protein
VTVEDKGVKKTFRIESKSFDDWLGYAYYMATQTGTEAGKGRAANESAIKTAKNTLVGIARHEGEEIQVFLRVANWQDGYVIDLGLDDWSVIFVSSNGWQVLPSSPVKFWRTFTLRSLPVPIQDGSLEKLWGFANIPVPVRGLVLAWMLETLRPETPYPVLELVGAQGTAKSSTQDKMRRLIDPNAVNLRAAPKSVEDMFVSAGCNHLASFNNLSYLNPQEQDALCNLATGGGFAGRTLYTNADETLIECKRPVVVNAIVPVVSAQDLTDRVVHVEMEPLQYRDETEIEAAFAEAAPSILGGLLDLFFASLAKLPEVKLDHLPRMGDFAKLGEAMMQAQGYEPGSFIALYEENRRQSVSRGLDASPVASAVRELAEASLGSLVFDDTMKRLLEKLSPYRESIEAWPKSPRGLGDALRRQAPALQTIGIDVQIGKAKRDGVPVTIRKREHCELRDERSSALLRPKKISANEDGEPF